LIHAPTAGLKQASAEGRLDTVASARKLLGLEGAEKAQDPTQAPAVVTETDEQKEFDLPPSSVQTSRRTLQ
jgi:glutamyl-tRNA reductase